MRKTILINLLWATLFVAACQSLNRTAYRETGATVVAVDVAMTEWGKYVKLHKPGVEAESRVRDAYEKYQKAATAVAVAAEMYLRNKESVPAKSNFEAALAASSAALAELVNLVRSFGVKL